MIYLIGSLGDTIVAIPAIRAVRRKFPDAELVVLQNEAEGGLVKASDVLGSELIDRAIGYKSKRNLSGRIAEYFLLALRLRKECFDAVAYTVTSERPSRSVRRDRLFFRLCGISSFLGFNAFSKEELYPIDEHGRPVLTPHEALRRLNRLVLDGIEPSPDDIRSPLYMPNQAAIEEVDAWLLRNRSRPNLPLISLAPGCKGDANLWPGDNFVELGRKILQTFDCEIVIVGGPNEKSFGEELVRTWGSGINGAGAFSVAESAALISRCEHHIGLDTGTTHLAAGVGTKCFVIFGQRSNPGLWYPLGEGHSIVTNPVPCSGCRSENCPVPGHPCMSGISVEMVWKRLESVLADIELKYTN